MSADKPILVLGANGKTGRRVLDRLTDRGRPVRAGSRRGDPAFDWEDESTWEAAFSGTEAAYVTYYPDIAVPGAVDKVRAVVDAGLSAGTRHFVLLSGRGEDEAEAAEKVLRDSGADWTILRCSWFAQNFSEGILVDPVLSGTVALPVDRVTEPFVDTDDIADVAVAALTDPRRHVGKLYELTGPRLLTFADAVADIAAASGREVRYLPVSVDEYTAAAAAEGVPPDVVELIAYLFTTVLDGRNSSLTEGVRQALGREPKDFRDYARDAAATGVWNPQA